MFTTFCSIIKILKKNLKSCVYFHFSKQDTYFCVKDALHKVNGHPFFAESWTKREKQQANRIL